jgi:hypothetical protein
MEMIAVKAVEKSLELSWIEYNYAIKYGCKYFHGNMLSKVESII